MSVIEPGTSSVGAAWDRLASAYQNSVHLASDVVGYGPGMGTEADYRLLGSLSGKRMLDLGCGGGQSVVAAAKQGAIAIGVDISVEQLAYARRLVEQEEVKAELKHGDLAELAFQRADSIDVATCAFALQYVRDLNRVFRQVHRVLRPNGVFVFSMPHPMASVTGEPSIGSNQPDQLTLEPPTPEVKRSYFDDQPLADTREPALAEYQHTVSDIFMGLVRSGYRVEVMMEPDIAGTKLPKALIIRARKES